ncbi:Signal recognition particle, subunit Srp68 [Ceraceosorus bombacis]|uniref:Signal recognition particle subunit SRP68 n=1 Tax=Ceraceosorus bombacis TaxID=401625 RepID=A0A0P1BJ54_9BASI|nr:Signal recognition particle, subunit Srp68 [Ceraceosorus bombacis]
MELDLTPAPGDQPTTPLAFPLLSLVNVARNEHGLRTHDFKTYRHFCTTKVHRLRSGLKITHADEAHAPKSDPAAQQGKNRPAKNAGKGRKKPRQQPKEARPNVFTKKSISLSKVMDSRPLQLLLFEAERSWAFVQDLRTDDDHSSRQLATHARRALSWLRDLEQLAGALASRIDVRGRGQVAAYIANQRGSLAFDREDYPAALRKLSVARKIYAALANAAVDSKMEALDNAWIDSSEAQIRFCAYSLELGEGTPDELADAAAPSEVCAEEAADFENLMSELTQLGSQQKSRTAFTLSWRGEVIPVRNPQLIDALARVSSAEALLDDAVHAQRDVEAAPANRSRKDGYKRERLTSAQRTAKKRASVAGAPNVNGAVTGSGPGANASSSVSKSGGRTELDPYDQALGALSDAEALARSLVEDNAAALAKSHSARYQAVGADLRRAHEWLSFRLQSVRVRRNTHLIDQVVAKAAQRDKRASELLEKRLASGVVASKKSRRSSTKPSERRAKKPAKPQRAGLQPKKPRTTPRTSKRRPAKSGTKRARRARLQAKEERARDINAAHQHRRQARVIPGVAKLLDGSEASLQTAAALNLVESHPDVSSLVDAKIAWYRAEIFRVLASAFKLAERYDHALLLLSRASLSLRQARAADELVEDHGKEDAEVPPRLNEEMFEKTNKLILEAQLVNRRELYFAQHGLVEKGSTSRQSGKRRAAASHLSLADSKTGQVVQDVASKHVTFEPTELDRAVQLDEATEAQLQRELRQALGGANKSSGAVATRENTSRGAQQQQHQERSEIASSPDKAALASAAQAESSGIPVSGTFDLADEQPEEDEDDHFEDADDEDVAVKEMEPADQKKGWLGGWFGGRK